MGTWKAVENALDHVPAESFHTAEGLTLHLQGKAPQKRNMEAEYFTTSTAFPMKENLQATRDAGPVSEG